LNLQTLGFVKRPRLSRRAVLLTMVLGSVFAIAILIRAYAAKYGFYLNEFDPYYDYYAASHVVALAQQHGLLYALFNNPPGCAPTVLTACHTQQGYFYWHDITTWFPYGRNVAATSQDGLQLAGALPYLLIHNVFGVQITLYDFLVLLPVFFGAFTAVLFYFLMRKIAGEAAGLFAALIVAVSPPLIERGNLGWFKSEPLALFLFVAASYLLLTVFDAERRPRSRISRGVTAGLLAGYANTAWGGALYFNAAFGLFFVILPFLEVDLASVSPSIVGFTAAAIFGSAIFPRPGVSIVTNPAGLALIGGSVFVLLAQWARTWVKPAEYRSTLLKLIFGFALAGLSVLSFGLVGGISLRYLSAIAPWARSGNPLVESVAEHFVPTGEDYFTSYLILLFFGVAGALVALRRRNVPIAYALIIGLTGLYVSAAFSRLLVYSSIALGILAGVGFAELAFALVKPSATPLVKKKQTYTSRNEMRVVYSVVLIALIVIPAGTYWIPNPFPCTTANTYFCDQSAADSGVSLANGATTYPRSPFNDWIQTLQWIRQNTPTNSVIISWWDYGYWITVMGNRTSAADNSTINGTRIAQIGRMFMSNATQAAHIAREIAGERPAYVLIFVVGSIVPINAQGQQYYILQVPAGFGFTAGGGDESKKQWFIRIGGLNESQYLECPSITPSCPSVDDFNLTPYALQNTLFAQLLPFKFAGFLVTQNQNIVVSPTYRFGDNNAPPVEGFSYPYSYTFGPNSKGPFRLAYASPSVSSPVSCPGNSNLQCFNAVLLYQVVSPSS
jgi:dolichyl-diphosphooligosaccharide--protein glycosyltransferase